MTRYEIVLNTLKYMNETQLTEMMHDLPFHVVEHLEQAIKQFYREYEESDISDYDEWKQADDRQRYNDIKSTQDSFK